MTNKKSTKRALISSTLAILMCMAMLIGTTFAWFTDTASTAVNKIQSGALKVDLEMATAWDNDGNPTKWETADGKKLTFKTVDNRESEKILWEPGCTYELPELRVVNKGNLALKYKVTINGVDGDAKLLEAIDFTVKKGDEEASLDGWEGYLLPKDAEPKSNVEEVETTKAITISGHMKEEAGNEYQDKTIEGIGITVVATQYTYEYDSNDKNYDEKAEYPVATSQQLKDALASAADGSTVLVNGDITVNDTIAIDKDITIKGEEDSSLKNAIVRVTDQAKVTIENVDFEGDSYIVNNGASSISMTDCTVNASGVKKETGRAAFLVLSASETTAPLKLDIRNNNFKVSSSEDAYAAAIFGWGYIADGSVISGNTFGSIDQRYTYIALKLMNFEDNATVTISDNTVYGTSDLFDFYAFDLYQNNSRDNHYVANISNNTVNVTGSNVENAQKFLALESNGAGNATINILGGNTMNGNNVTMDDMDYQQNSGTINFQ